MTRCTCGLGLNHWLHAVTGLQGIVGMLNVLEQQKDRLSVKGLVARVERIEDEAGAMRTIRLRRANDDGAASVRDVRTGSRVLWRYVLRGLPDASASRGVRLG